MGFDVVWGAYYVKWTSKDDIKNLIEGWSLIATPDLAGPISPDEEAVWIVGFHSPDPLPVHRVLGGAGFPSDERPEDWPDFHAGFMVMDRAGFVKRAGTVPETLYGPDGTPTPRPDAWDIADIAGLRPAPPPPTPRPTPGP